MYSTRSSCQILMKLQFSGRFSGEKTSIKFYENPSRGAELFNAYEEADRQTNRHDESKRCFLQFCERAQKWVFCNGRRGRGMPFVAHKMGGLLTLVNAIANLGFIRSRGFLH